MQAARSYIYTTALPPAVVRWSRQTTEAMTGMAAERRHLARLAERLRRRLAEAGLATGGDSQIVPVLAGRNERAAAFSRRLQEEGFLSLPIRPPTVPGGTSRLRVTLSAAHEESDVAALADGLFEAVSLWPVDQPGGEQAEAQA